jgi:cytochrome c biogenesis protein CcmG/thiol:disulfide interchange protein DsbE
VGQAVTETREEREAHRRRKERRRGRILLVAIALVAGLFLYSAFRQLRSGGTEAVGAFSIADHRAQAEEANRPAPEFEYQALEGGGSISSGEFAGSVVVVVVVVNFWASWCGPCRAEAPDLQEAWEAYRARGVRFLGVDFRDDRAAARAFVDEFNITYPSVYDPSGALAYDFGVIALPTTFVVGRDGVIAYHFTGIVTEPLLRRALEDVLGRER